MPFVATLLLAFLSVAAQQKKPHPYFKTPVFSSLRSSKSLTLIAADSYQQVEEHTCGPATAMSLMKHLGLYTDKDFNLTAEKKIANEMGSTPEHGTSQTQISAWLRKQKLRVESGSGGDLSLIKQKLSQGLPIMVNWIDWGGHWALVIGYDTLGTSTVEDDVVILADPSDFGDDKRDGFTYFGAERFAYMWFGHDALAKGEPKGAWITAQRSSKI